MISIVIAAASVVIGVVGYLQSIKTAERQRQTEIETRQAQLFMEIYDRYNQRELAKAIEDIHHNWEWEDYDDFEEKYGPKTNIDAWTSMIIQARFFDGIGVLVEKGLLDINIVKDLMGGTIIWNWETLESIYKENRKRLKRPDLWSCWEKLYQEIKGEQDPEPRDTE